MSSRRSLVLVGAILMGALAALLILQYVRGVEERAGDANALQEVWIAKGPIVRGMTAEEAVNRQLVGLESRRAVDIPPNAVRREEEIRGNVAAIDLQGGEILTTSMFLRDNEITSSKSVLLDEGNVALTLQLDQAAAVGGIIQPGDTVNILGNVSGVQASIGEIPVEGEGQPVSTSKRVFSQPKAYVYQNVKVLAVDQTFSAPVEDAVSQNTGAAERAFQGLITIQVPPDAVPLIMSAQSNGIYLTLNQNKYQPVPVPAVFEVEQFPGERGLTPYEQGAGTNGLAPTTPR